MEWVACSGTAVERCGEGAILTEAGCTACSAGAVPSSSKDRCILCMEGTHFKDGKCVGCESGKEYCDAKGMTVPKPKTLSCGTGKMLTIRQNAYQDNTCTPCPLTCGGGANTYIYAKGHGSGNACSQSVGEGSGTLFFACYPPAGDNVVAQDFTTGRHSLSFAPKTDGTFEVTVTECAGLPANAEWVRTAAEYPLACTFACRYGWDLALGASYRAAVKALVDSTRSDLSEFWTATQQQPPAGNHNYALGKGLWPTLSYRGVWEQTWEQPVSVPAAWDAAASRSFYQQNTFLKVDEAVVPEGLCLGPPTASSCPLLGFTNAEGSAPLQCALLARAGGLYALEGGGMAVLSSAKEIQCLAPLTQLYTVNWASYPRCAACLDRQPTIGNMPALALAWRGTAAWALLRENVYGFSAPGQCAPMTCTGATVPFSGACIPCSAVDGMAAACTPQTFNPSACTIGSTLEDVCVACSAPHAALLPQASTVDWGQARGWTSTCKYVCDLSYTSNPDSLLYGSEPCVTCASQIQAFLASSERPCGLGAFYFDAAAQPCGKQGDQQFLPYVPLCSPCAQLLSQSMVVVFDQHSQVVGSNAACLGLCDPLAFFTHLRYSRVRR